jgi:hypothetical protein
MTTANVQIWRIDFEDANERFAAFHSFVAADTEQEARTEAAKYLYDGEHITAVSGPVQGDRRKAMNG